MKTLSVLAVMMAAAAYAADPSATIGGITHDASSGAVTVSYVLSGADAIVTFSGDAMMSGGGSRRLGESAFRRVSGDVNRQVEASSAVRTITWIPEAGDSIDMDNGFKARLTLWSPSAPPDFMSAEIDGSKELRYYVSEAALPHPIADNYWKMDRILFRKIPAKDVVWNMASVSANRFVRLRHDYYLAVFPYTKLQAYNIASLDTQRPEVIAEGADAALCPQFRVSYANWRGNDPDDASAVYPVDAGGTFTTVRSKLGLEVDFPTEAEWEYAARAGAGGALYTGEEPTSENLQKIAWFADNGGKLHEVGLKSANRWGLHDMLGSVNEWCLDYYAPASYDYFKYDDPAVPVEDPVGPSSAQVLRSGTVTRVVRGDYYATGLSDLSKGLNHRDGGIYRGVESPSLGVRFRAPIPGAAAPKIVSGTGTWQSLDISARDAYWDCSGYENPAIIEVEQTSAVSDFSRCGFAFGTVETGSYALDTVYFTLGISNTGRLNSWPPPPGTAIIIE